MLQWFRARASFLAAMVLVSLATLGISAVIPHEADCHHDAGCALPVGAHDASAHRFTGSATDPAAHELHCLACHFARSFRPNPTATHHLAPSMVDAGSVHVETYTATRPSTAAQPPLRSPPASPVSA